MDFGKRLKTIRKESGITQEKLADKIGISRSTLAGYETEGKKPTYDTLVKIAQALNCSLDMLLDYEGNDNFDKKRLYFSPQDKKLYEKLSQRKDLKLLVKETEDLKPDSVNRIVKIINLIKEEIKLKE